MDRSTRWKNYRWESNLTFQPENHGGIDGEIDLTNVEYYVFFGLVANAGVVVVDLASR